MDTSNRAERDRIERVERAEAVAMGALVAAARTAGVADRYGIEAFEIEGAFALRTKALPVWMFNRAFALDGISDEGLGALLELYAAHRLPCALQIAPGPDAGRIEAWVRGHRAHTHKATPGRAWAKMWRGAEPIEAEVGAEGVRVEETGDAERFARVACAAFEMPPSVAPLLGSIVGARGWRAFLALHGDEPVGCGALHVDDAGAGAGWLGLGGTLPAARQRRVHRALMAHRIARALALGCAELFTETGVPVGDEPNPSHDNMLHVGFTRAYVRPTWVVSAG
jgi:hypothetical protein